jgi:uncharacterized membrane protein
MTMLRDNSKLTHVEATIQAFWEIFLVDALLGILTGMVGTGVSSNRRTHIALRRFLTTAHACFRT